MAQKLLLWGLIMGICLGAVQLAWLPLVNVLSPLGKCHGGVYDGSQAFASTCCYGYLEAVHVVWVSSVSLLWPLDEYRQFRVVFLWSLLIADMFCLPQNESWFHSQLLFIEKVWCVMSCDILPDLLDVVSHAVLSDPHDIVMCPLRHAWQWEPWCSLKPFWDWKETS